MIDFISVIWETLKYILLSSIKWYYLSSLSTPN